MNIKLVNALNAMVSNSSVKLSKIGIKKIKGVETEELNGDWIIICIDSNSELSIVPETEQDNDFWDVIIVPLNFIII